MIPEIVPVIIGANRIMNMAVGIASNKEKITPT
jgi:hypothetical protein